MSEQIPTIGRIVNYTLSKYDAEEINRRREDAHRYRNAPENTAIAHNPERLIHRQTGFQVHTGNQAQEGQVYPMIIVRVWGDKPDSPVNGQVFLDGNDTFWVTSVQVGEFSRRWAWPTRS